MNQEMLTLLQIVIIIAAIVGAGWNLHYRMQYIEKEMQNLTKHVVRLQSDVISLRQQIRSSLNEQSHSRT